MFPNWTDNACFLLFLLIWFGLLEKSLFLEFLEKECYKNCLVLQPFFLIDVCWPGCKLLQTSSYKLLGNSLSTSYPKCPTHHLLLYLNHVGPCNSRTQCDKGLESQSRYNRKSTLVITDNCTKAAQTSKCMEKRYYFQRSYKLADL